MPELNSEFTREIRQVRRRFFDVIDPLRPELFRYCRHLARNVWGAEDLVQDTLLKAFAKLGEVHWSIDNPRAYLFRIATNLWIDINRKQTEAAMPEHFDAPADAPPPLPSETRQALGAMLHALPPKERAALLLKDVFDFSLEETASYLQTTVGAVKAALHRGREKLALARESTPQPPVADLADAALLDRWCEAFNARDMAALTALMLADSTADVVGMVYEFGPEQMKKGSLGHTVVEEGNPQAQRLVYMGEPIVVLWYDVVDGDKTRRVVRDVLRFTQDRGNLASLRFYYFCPETLAEVCAALNLPLVDNGYRYG
ncbi:MAG: RNA polymerase sigma factor [Planctomycetes bacterium]|nr:RNA polymerase sigma factor [Planctomycetota bacterium]MCW8136136.1 RNA polymerase sigma factor [Planctomycetota bacterium]